MSSHVLIDYYARRAAEYERIYEKPERQADLARLREFVGRAFAGRRVLEIACGTGYWTEILNRSAEAVTAIDINEEVLGIARCKPGNAGVRFHRADAFRVAEIEGAFDAALAAFWWSHVARRDLAGFLEQLHFRMKPGARMVFLDNLYVEGSSTPISRRDAGGNTYQRRRLGDGGTFEVLKNFPTPEELRAAVGPAASEANVRCFDYYWVLQYRLRG